MTMATRTANISGKAGNASIRVWTALGVIWVLFIGYVLFRWATSDYIAPTPLPNGELPPVYMRIGIRTLEIGFPIVASMLAWKLVLRPLLRGESVPSDGLLLIGWLTLFFQDPFVNWTQLHAGYNSYNVNLGFWTAEIPGWVSPNSNLLPEPLIGWAGGYPTVGVVGAYFGVWCMRRVKAKWPAINNVYLGFIGILALMWFDLVLEQAFVFIGVYTYMGAIRKLSTFPGTYYQFPLYEAWLFGGMWGFSALLLYFRDDKGRSWVERGAEKLTLAKRSRGMLTAVRLLAIIGFLQTTEFACYSIPMNLFGVNGDPFPKDLPTYFVNGMCGPGTSYACPSPRIPIAKPGKGTLSVPPESDYEVQFVPKARGGLQARAKQ